jgi:hypothetical protein
MDSLDYGRRFVVDAQSPRGPMTRTRADVERYLSELHARLEGGRNPHDSILVEEEDGFSAAILGSEAHAALHLFPDLGRLSLHVFSRRDVLLSDLTRELARHFDVGRFESHLGSATKALPRDAARLRRALAGDRGYARIRLDDRLLAP